MTGDSFCVYGYEINDLIEQNPRSYWLKSKNIKEENLYYFDRSSMYREDWFLSNVDDSFLEKYEIKNPSQKLQEIYNYSDDEISELKLLEELEEW